MFYTWSENNFTKALYLQRAWCVHANVGTFRLWRNLFKKK